MLPKRYILLRGDSHFSSTDYLGWILQIGIPGFNRRLQQNPKNSQQSCKQ